MFMNSQILINIENRAPNLNIYIVVNNTYPIDGWHVFILFKS